MSRLPSNDIDEPCDPVQARDDTVTHGRGRALDRRDNPQRAEDVVIRISDAGRQRQPTPRQQAQQQMIGRKFQ